ncbi:DUF6234 family protein [Streptomyces sp. NPDC094438]|uniref:DUF6234 family protein n=1 Tax=Streptomyces sp. NPDC094438 TaxID=3366061 RepID=UPI00382BCD33
MLTEKRIPAGCAAGHEAATGFGNRPLHGSLRTAHDSSGSPKHSRTHRPAPVRLHITSGHRNCYRHRHRHRHRLENREGAYPLGRWLLPVGDGRSGRTSPAGREHSPKRPAQAPQATTPQLASRAPPTAGPASTRTGPHRPSPDCLWRSRSSWSCGRSSTTSSSIAGPANSPPCSGTTRLSSPLSAPSWSSWSSRECSQPKGRATIAAVSQIMMGLLVTAVLAVGSAAQQHEDDKNKSAPAPTGRAPVARADVLSLEQRTLGDACGSSLRSR